MSIEIDTSDLHRLAASFGELPPEAAGTIKQAIEVNARKIKDTWNGKLYREGHAKRTGRAITYDVTVDRSSVTAEIGAVRGSGRQAYIVRLLELGSANNGPHGYGSAALDENQDDLQTGLTKALADAQRKAGL